TMASSGSTAEASDIGRGTFSGADDPGTTAPPSKRQTWAREYRLPRKGWSPRNHSTVVWCALIKPPPLFGHHRIDHPRPRREPWGFIQSGRRVVSGIGMQKSLIALGQKPRHDLPRQGVGQT